MVLEIFSSLDPTIVKALITGLATSIAKVAAESGLKLAGQGSNKLLDGTGKLTQQAIDLFMPSARKYFENYAKRHGEFKILGMNRPLSIESVYTQVNFHPEAIQAYQSLDDHLKAFQGRRSRNDDRRAGMEVANNHQYLMILGGPGTGKMAKTPLLLTLICILFQSQGEVPTKRSTLYDRAISALLSEWDASKEIVRHQRYKDLDRKGKEELLSEIAYTNFIDNNLSFQQGEVSQQIEQILREILTDETRIDGLDVLRSKSSMAFWSIDMALPPIW